MFNREYKSDVFSMLMQEPENALQVYNGLNNTNYTDPSQIVYNTLEKGISLTVRNDASFILDTDVSFYEHQSTYNKNMALRQMIYYSHVLEPQAREHDLYAYKRIPIPTPHFVVFYNGIDKRPPVEIQKLSENFENPTDNPELELTCTIYNINSGYNQDLFEKCPILKQYTAFVERIRTNKLSGMDDEDAINSAIESCIKDDVLADFLKRRRNEVTKETMIDMTWEVREGLIRKEERAEGRQEGLKEGRIASLVQMIRNGGTDDDLRRFLDATDEEIAQARKELAQPETDT